MIRWRVLCVGNDWASDDGVGRRVAQVLARLALPEVQIVERTCLTLDALEDLTGIQQLVVVDAAATGDEPGAIVRWEPSELPPSDQLPSGHVPSLHSLLVLARRVYPQDFPERIVVLGLCAESLVPFNPELSPTVRRALPELLDRVLMELDCSPEERARARAVLRGLPADF